jgi:hypothetical protein
MRGPNRPEFIGGAFTSFSLGIIFEPVTDLPQGGLLISIVAVTPPTTLMYWLIWLVSHF